jgi:hypothetical protein
MKSRWFVQASLIASFTRRTLTVTTAPIFSSRSRIDLPPISMTPRTGAFFALGRRNWLFADTVKGAKASASLYSLVQTACANELEPYAYLCRLFDQLHAAQRVADVEALLPWNITPAKQARA